ncbi:hypothetical protein BDV93DRAFT_548268 [Ceratobasidium sp. AG-I]|nr:hypothetical protein BDV93DRAFT_548268 [Ceratobasidium sp. AG-I]
MPRRKVKNSKPKAEPQPQICDSVSGLVAETVLRGYYHAVFALIRGSPQRPRLPVELVVYICQLACFSQPNPSKALSAQCIDHRTLARPPCCGPWPGPKVLLRTPPLATLNGESLGIARFEVVVKSLRGTEYRTHEHWARFFIRKSSAVQSELNINKWNDPVWAFIQPDKLLRQIPTSTPAEKVPRNRVRDAIIDSSHALCQSIQVGDSLELGTSHFRAWVAGDMCHVVIRVFEYWEPSSAMLRLARMSSPLRQ